MIRDDLRSQSLDLLRFPLAVVVLVIHTFHTGGLILQGHEFSVDTYPFFIELNHFIDGFLGGQSVPIYFFISGFVFFLGIELTKEKYIQKLKNRVKTLLIPYIIWNSLEILLLILRLLPCFRGYLSYQEVKLNITISGLLSCFWMYNRELSPTPAGTEVYMNALNSVFPINIPLWFVRDLMVVVLFTPLLYWLLKRTRYYLVLLLGMSWFFLPYLNLELRHSSLLAAFFFFSWGAYMSINKKDMLTEFGHFFKSSVFLYPSLALLYVAFVHYLPDVCTAIKRLNVFVGLFFAYNMAAWLLRKNICKVNSFLASASFFIYVSHILICGRLLKVMFLLIKPDGNFSIFMVYLLSLLVTVVFLLLVFYLLRRYTPSFLKVIAGRK